MNYSQLVSDLLRDKIGYENFNPGLDNLKNALKLWNLDSINTKVITICGTNGKGETTRAIGHLLKKNYNYLQWTSPHVSCISERFVYNGHQIDSKLLYEVVIDYLDKYNLSELKLSFYEFLFIIFLEFNKKLNPDVLLLEVGLGGRLDAVNAIEADLVVLTSISRDHQEFLGQRYDQIIYEKLAVARPDKNLVSSLELKYLRQITKNFCLTHNLKWLDLFESNDQVRSLNYSLQNQLLAEKAYEVLLNTTVHDGMWQDYQSSTMQQWQYKDITFYGLGSHNPDGLRKLVQFLSQQNYNNIDTLIFSFSKRSIKDLDCMFKIVNRMRIPSKKLVGFNHPKAMDKKVLKEMAKAYSKVEFVDDCQKLIENLKPHCKVVVCGSYYFMGELKQHCNSST